MRFLISNDDGVHAPGLLALSQALATIGEVVVVAPTDEQSGYASALSVSKPLYAQTLPSGFVTVNGSPADCVYLALHELYPNTAFDYVITGINSGANLGQDVLFSGTFGAALTAQLFGVPAIATSLVGGGASGTLKEQTHRYHVAANEIVQLLSETAFLEAFKRLPYHVLNVNIPDVDSSDDIQGRKITTLGHSQIARPVHHMVDPRGRDAYWLSLRKRPAQPSADSDSQRRESLPDSPASRQEVPQRPLSALNTTEYMTDDQAVVAGYISLSPVRLHHTLPASLSHLSALAL